MYKVVYLVGSIPLTTNGRIQRWCLMNAKLEQKL